MMQHMITIQSIFRKKTVLTINLSSEVYHSSTKSTTKKTEKELIFPNINSMTERIDGCLHSFQAHTSINAKIYPLQKDTDH